MGYLMLQGGAEFSGLIKVSDLRALELAGGLDTKVSIIPAAAAPDNNHTRAGLNGRQWFQSLGAKDVSVLPLIDEASANDHQTVSDLKQSRLIYLLGGFPGYLAQTLGASAGWAAIKAALESGAVLAGSSAGAMVLCEYLYDPHEHRVIKGLGLLANACLLPHHDTFGRQWAARLQKDLPRSTLIGIDEKTGAINDASGGGWHVYGRGAVTLYRHQRVKSFGSGDTFEF